MSNALTINTSDPYAAFEAVLASEGPQYFSSMCLFITANGAKDAWNTPMKEVITKLANIYVAAPNATDDVVAAEFGIDPFIFTNFLQWNFGLFNESGQYILENLPQQPHPRNTTSIVPIFAVFTVLSTIVMMLRLWSRITIVGRVQAFDWLAVVSYFMIIAWGSLVVNNAQVAGEWAAFCDQTYNGNRAYQADYNMSMAFYPLIIFSIKAALLYFYFTLSTWRPLRWTVYITTFMCFGNAMGGFFAWLFQCNFVDLWNHGADAYLVCGVRQKQVVFATGAINIFTDVIIWLIPMPLVWKLQLYPRERIVAIFTFGLGAVACIASVVRLIEVNEFIVYSSSATSGDSILPISVWAIIELNLALICASAPALRALVIKHVPQLLSYAYGSSTEKSSSGGLESKKSRFGFSTRKTGISSGMGASEKIPSVREGSVSESAHHLV